MKEALGKIDHHLFESIIQQQCGFKRKEVSAGPQFGVDVSVVDLSGGMAMALTSDPLSLIPSLGLQESAWLSVQLMANDMATTGFAPQFAQFVLNLPPTLSKQDFETYWNYIHRFCKEIGVAITGGHTGFIEGQHSTIAGGGTFITIAPKEQIHLSRNAQVGDAILVTKQCALSAAAILALSFPQTVQKELGAAIAQQAQAAFYQTSSLKDGLVAAGEAVRHPDITAMHDVTEGGVLGAIYELAVASGNGAFVDSSKLPVGEAQQQVCSLFSIDARYCVGAGAMVICCKREAAPQVMARLHRENIACCEVGEISNKETGIKLLENGVLADMPYYEEDPYWAAFFKAYKLGWK